MTDPGVNPQRSGDTEPDAAGDLDPAWVRGAIEAILMVIDTPVEEVALATALDVPVPVVTDALAVLSADYAGRGFALRQLAGGWRIYSRPEYVGAVEKFLLDGAQAKLTQASLETLAVIAYRQPISRGRVSAVRGVNVDGVVRTLLTRGLIEEVGTDAESGAVLYGTTGFFLERLGLSDVSELPALAPYLPDVDIIAELTERGPE